MLLQLQEGALPPWIAVASVVRTNIPMCQTIYHLQYWLCSKLHSFTLLELMLLQLLLAFPDRSADLNDLTQHVRQLLACCCIAQ